MIGLFGLNILLAFINGFSQSQQTNGITKTLIYGMLLGKTLRFSLGKGVISCFFGLYTQDNDHKHLRTEEWWG